jgi:glutathione peroxidase
MNIKILAGLGALLLILTALGGINMLEARSLYDYEVQKIDGSVHSLKDYQGKVLLIVNTASKCGFTKQYDGLQDLYEKYADQGLVVLGFPANNFLSQEPGSNEEIIEFCRLNYGVSFPMYAKISVRGKDIHPMYKYLTDKKSRPEYGGAISWNFTKFLISRDGRIIGRYAPQVTPQDKNLVSAIEQALK